MGAPDLAKHAILALHLLFELGADDSPARPYLATLPKLAGRESPSVPLLWTPVQVATLRGTPAHSAALSRSKFVAAAHEALFPGGGGVPLDAFAWALSSVLSRAASGAGMPYTLMPGIDLLNHGGDNANCALGAMRTGGFGGGDTKGGVEGIQIDEGFGDIEVRCTRDVAPGEQLTISYGDDADNDRLMRLYGFTVPGNPNDRRQLELRVTGLAAECWNMTEVWGPGLNIARQAILRMHGLPRLDAFVDDDDVDENDLIQEVMTAMDKDPKAAERAAAVFRDPDSGGTPPKKSGGGGKRKSDNRVLHTSNDCEHSHSHGGDGGECHGHGDGGDKDEDNDDSAAAAGEEDDTAAAVTWRCYVAHPSKQFPPRPHKPMDSATDAAQAAVDVATSLAAGERGGSVSVEVLLASLRVHLLRGDEPPGPDGLEPNPWAPMSEQNEVRGGWNDGGRDAQHRELKRCQPHAVESAPCFTT